MRNTQSSEQAEKPSNSFDIDRLYDAAGIAPWLSVSARGVLEMARRGDIPVVKLNQRVLRFHPRTILARKGGLAA